VPRTGVLHVDDLDVEVTVRRVQRMNVRVHPPDGAVRLSVPPRTSDRAVVRFVRESRAWIEHHRARIRRGARRAAARPTVAPRRRVAGEVWRWFGRMPALGRDRAGATAVRIGPCGRLVVRVPDRGRGPAVRAVLDRWQRRELRDAARTAARRLGGADGCPPPLPRAAAHVDALGLLRPGADASGSTSALVERAPALLEYVVVHELAHLREASHGPRFQRLMDEHLPDWRAAPTGARRGVMKAAVDGRCRRDGYVAAAIPAMRGTRRSMHTGRYATSRGSFAKEGAHEGVAGGRRGDA
jgi:predicted metal-dependent hydrolase